VPRGRERVRCSHRCARFALPFEDDVACACRRRGRRPHDPGGRRSRLGPTPRSSTAAAEAARSTGDSNTRQGRIRPLSSRGSRYDMRH
jgi:hypothetical protein